MLAGRYDALALTAIASGVGASVPFLSGAPAAAGGMLAGSALGSAWLYYKHLSRSRDPVRDTQREGFVLRSDQTFGEHTGASGIRLGYTLDTGTPLDLPNDIQARHMEIVGMTGVGKTVLGEWMLWQQMCRGGGFLFIDAKLDRGTRDKMAYLAKLCGREDDFMVINVAEPHNSHTYNPIIDGEPPEVASRLVSLIPDTSNNPGADHYRQQANMALTTVVAALKASKRLYHFGDLSVLLQSPKAIEELLRLPPPGSAEARNLNVFVDAFRSFNKDTGVSFDMRKIKDTFGGIAGRVGQFASGNYGKVFNTYAPDINLYEAIRQNKLIYVMLPTMAQSVAATALAKLVVSDLRSACAKLQDLDEHLRPRPPFMLFADEFSSYVEPSVAEMLQQARSAGLFVILAVQAIANLRTVGEDFAEKVAQNCLSKVFFKFASEDAENASNIIGSSIKYTESLSSGGSEGESSPFVQLGPQIQESDSVSLSAQYRETDTYRVSPDQLRSLNRGECIIYSNSRVFHIRVPKLETPARLPPFRKVETDPDARLERLKRSGYVGANFEKDFRRFLTGFQKPAGEGKSKKDTANEPMFDDDAQAVGPAAETMEAGDPQIVLSAPKSTASTVRPDPLPKAVPAPTAAASQKTPAPSRPPPSALPPIEEPAVRKARLAAEAKRKQAASAQRGKTVRDGSDL